MNIGMTRRLGLSLVTSICAGMLAVGCGDKESSAPAARTEEAAPTASNDQVRNELEALRAELAALRGESGTARAAGRDTSAQMRAVDARLAEFAGSLDLEHQQRRVASLNLLKSGLAAESNGEIQNARDLYKQAWETDLTNVEAEKKYWEMLALLDEDRYGDIRNDWEQMRDERAAKIQQIRLQIENDFNAGVRLFNEGNYEDAIKKFGSVNERIQFSDTEIDTGNFKEQCKEYIRQAEAKKLIVDAERRRNLQEQAVNLAGNKEEGRIEEEMRRIQLWLNEARQAFDMEKYDVVAEKCGLIFRLDPNNPEAQALMNESESAVTLYVQEKIRKDTVRAWQDQLLEAQDVLTPWWDPDNVVFPPQVQRSVNETSIGLYSESGSGDSDGASAIRRIMENTHIPALEVEQRNIGDLISILQEKTGINMVLDNPLSDPSTAPVVSLRLRDMPASQVFDVLKDLYRVDYEVVDFGGSSRPTIMIVDAATAGGDRITFGHYVADIVAPVPDYPAASVLTAPAAKKVSFADEAGVELSADEKARQESGESLIKLVKSAIEPASWTQRDQGGELPQIRLTAEGLLLVKHTRRVHQQIAELATNMRKQSGVMVSVETAFITITDDTLHNVLSEFNGLGDTGVPVGLGRNQALNPATGGVTTPARPAWGTPVTINGVTHWLRGPFAPNYDFRSDTGAPPFAITDSRTEYGGLRRNAGIFFDDNGDGDVGATIVNAYDQRLGRRLGGNGGLAFQWTFLDDTQVNWIFHAVKQDSRARTMTSPRLTLFNSQRANVSLVNSRSYIQDYDVQVATGASILDPVVGHVDTGAVLDVRPSVSQDKKFVNVELRATLSTMVGDIQTLPAALGGPNSPVIELPRLDVQEIHSTLRIPDGGTLLVGGNRTVREADLESSAPFINRIPVVSFFFRQKGKDDELSSTLILVRAKVIILDEALERQLRYGN